MKLKKKNKSDTNKMRNTLRKVLPSAKQVTNSLNIGKIQDDDKSLKDDYEITQKLNNHFVTIGKIISYSKSAKDDTNNDASNIKNYLKTSTTSSIAIDPPNALEIFNIIFSLKTKKNIDQPIPSYFLKVGANTLLSYLAYIFTYVFDLGIFPDALKIAIEVLPLYKSCSKCNINNYWPISILPCLSKIFEKIIYTRFVNFFDKFKILQPYMALEKITLSTMPFKA